MAVAASCCSITRRTRDLVIFPEEALGTGWTYGCLTKSNTDTLPPCATCADARARFLFLRGMVVCALHMWTREVKWPERHSGREGNQGSAQVWFSSFLLLHGTQESLYSLPCLEEAVHHRWEDYLGLCKEENWQCLPQPLGHCLSALLSAASCSLMESCGYSLGRRKASSWWCQDP